MSNGNKIVWPTHRRKEAVRDRKREQRRAERLRAEQRIAQEPKSAF
jgi:hypothetical protein